MNHLFSLESSLPVDKILSNWTNTAEFIYSTVATVDSVRVLLRHEVLNKNRDMIVNRLKVRFLSLLKRDNDHEIEQDIHELKETNGIRKGYGETLKKAN